MQTYIGTKMLRAKPMLLGDYNNLRRWGMPPEEDPGAEGYLVEYLDGGKPNHEDFANYISWSPKSVFEAAYQPTTGMNFGHAMEMLKAGKSVKRAGWNGKDQFVYMITGQELQNGLRYGFGEYPSEPEFVATLCLRNAQNKLVVGWVPSIGDLFANDWGLL